MASYRVRSFARVATRASTASRGTTREFAKLNVKSTKTFFSSTFATPDSCKVNSRMASAFASAIQEAQRCQMRTAAKTPLNLCDVSSLVDSQGLDDEITEDDEEERKM
eukprot:maker-scaffold_7-snap-gene-2.16-mRNA-1 protein AED:0.00 eAED:0.00 QI:407/1/1/1/1/1/2/223/107